VRRAGRAQFGLDFFGLGQYQEIVRRQSKQHSRAPPPRCARGSVRLGSCGIARLHFLGGISGAAPNAASSWSRGAGFLRGNRALK
jgi:hypothetical protein